MSEHQHGSMDTRVHEKTFEGFVKASKFSVIAIIAIVVVLALVGA
jgi:hypothetical protein